MRSIDNFQRQWYPVQAIGKIERNREQTNRKRDKRTWEGERDREKVNKIVSRNYGSGRFRESCRIIFCFFFFVDFRVIFLIPFFAASYSFFTFFVVSFDFKWWRNRRLARNNSNERRWRRLNVCECVVATNCAVGWVASRPRRLVNRRQHERRRSLARIIYLCFSVLRISARIHQIIIRFVC